MRIGVLAVTVLAVLVLCLSGCSAVKSGTAQADGPKIVLQVDSKPGDKWPSSAADRSAVMEETKQVLMKRTMGIAGVTEPSITTEGDDKLVVVLPGVKDTKQVERQLTSTGRLEFYYLKNVQSPVNPLASWKMDLSGTDERSYTFTGPKEQTLSTSKPGDMQKIMSQVVGVPKVKPVLTGADLMPNAKASLRPSSNRPVVEIEFSEHGTRAFSDFTRAHIGEILGVFYGGRLLTAPKINEPIADGKAIIEGFKSLREANEVAQSINGGALPVHLKVVSP